HHGDVSSFTGMEGAPCLVLQGWRGHLVLTSNLGLKSWPQNPIRKVKTRRYAASRCCASVTHRTRVIVAIVFCLFPSLSGTLIHQTREKLRRDDELAPFGVESRARPGRNRLFDRASLLLEPGDILVDGDQHVAVSRKLRLVAHGLAVARDNDGIVAHGGDVGFRRL